MSFINTVSPQDAEGELREMYLQQQGAWGFVPNYAKVFSHRPEIMPAWAGLLRAIRHNLDDETFELVTLSAARALGSSYCALAHGKKLATEHFSEEEVTAFVSGVDSPTLSTGQKAMMRFAAHIVRDSSSVSQHDIDELRDCGYEDGTIFDIVAAAAARCFFAKLVDALGALPDASFADMDPELQSALCVGRKISTEATEVLS